MDEVYVFIEHDVILQPFFNQSKGTAMVTLMAINYVNLFMTNLETPMLDNSEKEHGST